MKKNSQVKEVKDLTVEEVGFIFDDDEVEDFQYKLEDKGKWINESKYQYKDVVFSTVSLTKETKYYMISNSRSGSPFTDWYYDDLPAGKDLKEVYPVEKTVITWKNVK